MEKVYFVGAPGRIKIGFTRKPEKRLAALRRADMEELTVIAVVDGPRSLELNMHRLLAAHRLRGEWFVDCPEVRAAIDEAIAGKHRDKPTIITAAAAAEKDFEWPKQEETQQFTPEYQILQRLSDDTNAALDRGDDKYEIRGRVAALLAAAEVFIQQRSHISPLTD